MTSKAMLNAAAGAAAIAGLHLASIGAAQAQDTQSDNKEVVLEDIVVTADRAGFGADLVQVGTFRNARIIDVPLTVNVVPQELLRSQAAQGLFDALRNTAGVSRAQTNGVTFDNVTIRGITVENRTSFRLNGSLPIVNLVDLPLENKERVEVLKGVGAIYYGYAPPSGIINLLTKRADRDVANFTMNANNFGGAQMTADVGHRFGDSFGLRFNGAAGIVEPGIKRFSGERFVAALAADLKIAEGVDLRMDVEHVAKDVTEPGVIQLNPANSALIPPQTPGQRILPPIPPADLNLGGENLRSDAMATNALARLDVRLSPQFALTLEAGQAFTKRSRDAGTFQSLDLRPTSANYGRGSLVVSRARNQRYRNRNLRGELAGAFPTGPVVHNLIVGTTMNWRYQNGATSPGVTVAQSFFDPIDIQLPEPTARTEAPLNIKDFGAYITDRAVIGPVELLGGVRYSDYSSRAVSAAGAVTDFAIKTWTPFAGAVFKPTRWISVYGTYLEGLEETQPAPLTSRFPFDVLPPSKSTQYEAGIKIEPQTGLLLQFAGFQIERASAFVDPTDNTYKLAGRARYKGIEASLTGDITPDVAVYLSGLYIDAQVIRANPATLIGKRPENTAKWTGNAFVEVHPRGWNGLAIGGGAFYTSSRPVNALNEAFIPGYVVFNAMARYALDDVAKGMTVQFNVENLANRHHWSGTGNNQVAVGLQRTAKLTLRVAL